MMFDILYRGVSPNLATILKELFTLLMHLAANSTDSGLTPSVLSGLFGPLIFGLGPHSCPFDTAHAAFVRSSGALEHLLLAFIRFEEAKHERLKGGFPGRLRDWTKGYPGMIISDRELDQGLPRRGVKVKRLEKVRRYVRAYSKDLLSSGQEWGQEMKQCGGVQWEAWESVLPPVVKTRRSGPRVSEQPRQPSLTDRQRKRLFLASDTIPLPISSSPSISFEKVDVPGSQSNGSGINQSASATSRDSLVNRQEKYGSLADKSWSEFEGFGFGEGVNKDRLEFNLNEGAKKVSIDRSAHCTYRLADPGRSATRKSCKPRGRRYPGKISRRRKAALIAATKRCRNPSCSRRPCRNRSSTGRKNGKRCRRN